MAENDTGLTIHKKLSPQNICPDLLNNPGKGVTRWLFRLGGRVEETVDGASTFGRWVGLVGNFTAFRFDNGESFSAPKAFLPAGIGNLIEAQLMALQENDENAAMDFVFDVGITSNRREVDNPGKYDYVIRKPDGGELQRKAVSALLNIAPLPPGVSAKALPQGAETTPLAFPDNTPANPA